MSRKFIPPAIKRQLRRERGDIDSFRWILTRRLAKLKDGYSFVVPVCKGAWRSDLIVRIRNGKLADHETYAWRRYE